MNEAGNRNSLSGKNSDPIGKPVQTPGSKTAVSIIIKTIPILMLMLCLGCGDDDPKGAKKKNVQ